MGSRSVIVGRALNIPYNDVDAVAKQVPNELHITIDKALTINAELKKMYDEQPQVKELIDTARALEGMPRNASTHAAGVVITKNPVDTYVPLSRNGDQMVTQFTMVTIEELGLLKMDFLGLRTLTVISDALENIHRNRGIKIDIDRIPLDDKATYDLLNRGDTVAVFQLESGGMQTLCRQFVVETIEHIIALLAIYRPGPMEFIPTFVGCKKGLQPIVYDHPKMEPILKETYGIMLYQEQIMEVVQKLAGFTLGHADIVRRAIGKKKMDIMEKEKINFIKELWPLCDFFFIAPTYTMDDKFTRKNWKEGAAADMEELYALLEGLTDFSIESQKSVVDQWAAETGKKPWNPWRVCLVGAGKGPDMYALAAFLGKEETLRRLRKAIEVLG